MFHIKQIDREENKKVDELARLAGSLSIVPEGKVTVLKLRTKSIEEEEFLAIMEEDDCRNDVVHYLQI